ncbi:polyprenyl diphosphate synthase [bacterium]|nr:polyprenyl diphosphate synthase [bacterium]
MPNEKAQKINIPSHVAIIPDGNRRWAKDKGLPTLVGHKRGFDTANKDIDYAREIGIHTMTLWAFSTENWNRSKEEVDYLMNLYENNIEKNLEKAKKHKSRIVHLGRKDRIPESLRKLIEKAESETKDFDKHVLNIALDYGGHDEIVRAATKIAEDVQKGIITPQDISKEVGKYKNKYPYYLFKNYLDTGDQTNPYPDLIIRTSGEQRFSGFLSWQLAYSEIYFAQVHMPDFGPKEFQKALDSFSNRERRFGGDSETYGGGTKR